MKTVILVTLSVLAGMLGFSNVRGLAMPVKDAQIEIRDEDRMILNNSYSAMSPADRTGQPIENFEKVFPTKDYPFGNPAGCAEQLPENSGAVRLAQVQAALPGEYNLAERRQTYIWNGPLGVYLDVSNDPYVYEFVFNSFQPPLTYRADQVATIFLNNGFVVWLREYGGSFRLLAIPLVDGVMQSHWAEYVSAYWEMDGLPDDQFIYPVMKKLPCHWAIDAGYVSAETLAGMFSLSWQVPDYLLAGQAYLAENCADAHQVAREKIGFWDATSVCGPLAWTIIRDANSFPYRIGSWTVSAAAFTSANPKWNGQPWGTFDPETFDLIRTDDSLPGYDFAKRGNLYPGDIIYSYSTLYYQPGTGWFDHIFLVAAVNEHGERISVSNMVQNFPYVDCSIEEVILYQPGNRETGVVNREWNNGGYGKTGTSGFDVFRWKWITYHVNGLPIQYTVRWGDTLETVGFDWKISPEALAVANQLPATTQLTPGQVITLPAP